MRRADRLFRLVQLLRDGRLWTAARLAETAEVSERTIYRDIADLTASGVPIEGAAGVGYVMRAGFDLPPLMFTEREVTALALGARLVSAWGGPEMADGARDALSKIEAVLPRAQVVRDALERLAAPPVRQSPIVGAHLDLLDRQVRERRVTQIVYVDADGRQTERRVNPLGLWFWGAAWTLVAWCELRSDFRMFRVDRITRLTPSEMRYDPVPDRNLRAFLDTVEAEEGCTLPPDPFA